MSLQAYMQARGLQTHVKSGLQALGNHSRAIEVSTPTRAVDSINLDEALVASLPNAPRWDYGIGLQKGKLNSIAWVEVHPASSSKVEDVLKKLDWLQTWLKQTRVQEQSPMQFHWIATGSVQIDQARRRKLAAKGLKMPSSHLRLE